MPIASLRRETVSRALFRVIGRAIPTLSPTEREAIDAGEPWLDAALFSGNPDWSELRAVPPAALSAEERAFLAGPVEELCALVDEWEVARAGHDLPPEAWAFLKHKKFFGMIIPRAHGGLGFSAFAHSEVVRKIASHSVSAAVTAMVPNSLGPGELILAFGTTAQQAYWLPRLADGREIPCFGLTSADAGSDAAAMKDEGVICRGLWKGEEVVGIRLNWAKRYITLCPVATILGLAFKLRDPDRLLGGEQDLGITVALVPTDLEGVSTGRRHFPAMQSFLNGPTSGRDVFIPLDHIIGGAERAGQGWRMLMSALAAGRGVSLPSMSAAAAAFAAHTTGAYARIRKQFGLSIGAFEGVQERLARIAANAYLLDAARRLTCAGLDQGRRSAVVASIMKLHATERMRVVINDAMDVHGGRAVMEGPRNYLASQYRTIPVGITVEGANILTRSLMVFGQGAIRAHPYLLAEIQALGDEDRTRALAAFDKVLWRHVGHFARTAGRALLRGWSGGALAAAPKDAGRAKSFYRQLSRYSAAFALTADAAFLSLGGALKRRELLSARLGDILSDLYLLAAALKRWEDEGRRDADWPLVCYCMESGLAAIEQRFDEVFANLPYAPVNGLLRVFAMPFGRRRRGPSDQLIRDVAVLLTEPSEVRARLVGDICIRTGGPVDQLTRTFEMVANVQPIHDRLRKAGYRDWRQARAEGQVDDAEASRLEAVDAAVKQAIAVDDFAPGELEAAAAHKTAKAAE